MTAAQLVRALALVAFMAGLILAVFALISVAPTRLDQLEWSAVLEGCGGVLIALPV